MRWRWAGGAALLAMALAGSAPAQDEVEGLFGEACRLFEEAANAKAPDWGPAREKLQEVIAKAPQHFEAHWRLGESFEKETNHDAARDWFVKASDLQPGNALAALKAASGQVRYKKWAEALPYLVRLEGLMATDEAGRLNGDEQDLVSFCLPPAMVEALWNTGKRDEAAKRAEAAIAAEPYFPSLTWFLGQHLEAAGEAAKAKDRYKQGLNQSYDKEKLANLRGNANHRFGLEDHWMDSNARIVAIDRRAAYLELQEPRYGELKNDGKTFVEAQFEFQVDLPHPKALKLKKDARYPWVFSFQMSHEVKPGSINTHVIDVLWHQDNLQDVDVVVRCNASAFSTAMNTQTAGAVKWVEPENLAKGTLKDMTEVYWVDVKNVKPVKKARFAGRLEAFSSSFDGREKGTVEDVTARKAKGEKLPDPPVWQVTHWTIKGKKYTYQFEVKVRAAAAKDRQKDIDLLLRHLKFPA